MTPARSKFSSAGQQLPVRTSSSHPITLSHILTWKGGQLSLCFCPGKCVVRDGVKHTRDLQEDLHRLKDVFGISCILCLLNLAELRSFGLRGYEAAVQKAGLQLLTFPIIEMAAPSCIQQTHQLVQQVAQLMSQGQHIAVHCRGGVGRAGLIAACLLLYTEQAVDGKDAIQKVRQRRCKAAIEKSRQEDFVCKYASLCQQESVQH